MYDWRLLKNFSVEFFYKHTTLAIMPILASDALLRENKKIQWQNVTPRGIEPRPLMNLWFQVQHSPFSDDNIGIIANVVCLWKNPNDVSLASTSSLVTGLKVYSLILYTNQSVFCCALTVLPYSLNLHRYETRDSIGPFARKLDETLLLQRLQTAKYLKICLL